MSLLTFTPFIYDSFYSDLFEDKLVQSKDETGNLHLEIDLPGIKKEDVNLIVNERVLEIKAERKNKKYSFQQKYTLPRSVDSEKLTAKMEDGVLYITIPSKTEEKQRTKLIKIE